MSGQTLPAITGAQFLATVMPAVVAPLTNTIPIAEQIGFANVANLQVISGSYTPADDTKVLASALGAISPNFIILIVDQLVNLSTTNSGAAMFDKLPVNKIHVSTLIPIVAGANPITAILLDGTAANPYPMAQGTPVYYTLIFGQAAIS